MRFLSAELFALTKTGATRRNLGILRAFFLSLAALIAAFTVLFHVLMAAEGQKHSWLTGLYWTLTVMSTLGFGDITFHGDVGRMFSVVVLVSGTVALLVILPFVFIEFFWNPWMEAQAQARAPRQLPVGTRGHVLLSPCDPVTMAFIDRLKRFGQPYRLIVSDPQEALRLHDEGMAVMIGDVGDPEVWKRAQVSNAALVALSSNDYANTNAAFTVRGIHAEVPIIATAHDRASIDVLELAGATRVLHLADLMGQALSRRTLGGDAVTHTIGEFGALQVAEASISRTPLVGKTLREANLRRTTGLNVIGIWDRGDFAPAHPDSTLSERSVLVLAGTHEQLSAYDKTFAIYSDEANPVLILGGGRVGRATARALEKRRIQCRIVDRLPERKRPEHTYIIGNAADLEVLKQAGIFETPAIIITTNDDDMNVFLTIYCRKLRPDVQILTRVSLEQNVETLHRAGTDFVMSYASMGANSMLNLLNDNEILMLAEGLDLFKMRVPEALLGRSIAECGVRERSGATIVAIMRGDELIINPDPQQKLDAQDKIIMIGPTQAEAQFCELFGHRPL